MPLSIFRSIVDDVSAVSTIVDISSIADIQNINLSSAQLFQKKVTTSLKKTSFTIILLHF
jgi:hypothetical protein